MLHGENHELNKTLRTIIKIQIKVFKYSRNIPTHLNKMQFSFKDEHQIGDQEVRVSNQSTS